MTCPSKDELRAARGVVLLVAGTGSRPEESFSWGYQRALAADGFATCTAALPEDGLGSFTDAAVAVRKAIRRTSRLAGHRISVVGHSQGGALPVWDMKFFPGVARRLDDVVSLAGPFGRTQLGNQVCAIDPSEHGLILGDPVGYALTLDALTQPGPADPSRIPASTCQQTFIPHGDPTGSEAFLQTLGRFTTGLLDPRRWVDAEPPVPAYARPWAG